MVRFIREYTFYGTKVNPLPRKLFSLYYEVAIRQKLKFVYNPSGSYVIKDKTIYNYDCKMNFKEEENQYIVSLNEFSVRTKKYNYMNLAFEKVGEFAKRNPKYNAPIFENKNYTRNKVYAECFPIAVFDTERNMDNIIQFGGQVIDYKNGELVILNELNIYVKLPWKSQKVRPHITKMTHIDKKLLNDVGLDPNIAAYMIHDFLKDAKTVCGQSVYDDIASLKLLFQHHSVSEPKCLNKVIDVSIIYQYIKDNVNLVALEKEAQDYGIVVNSTDLHNAYFDALLTKEVLIAILDEFIKKFKASPIIRAYQLEGKNRMDDLKNLYFTKRR